jgi:serine/threonine protein phosphatase PrpC
MRANGLRASGSTHPGRQRDVNEDRFHADVRRGLFMVIDGVGGHLAGGKAADVALSTVRAHLENGAVPTADRVREAITSANNEIHRLAGARPEWHGMACVLTLAVTSGDRAIVGHVGDTRLYKLHDGGIRKITRDHSPVGELEDARALNEDEAMRHPRRNEVYRDVGSDRHDGDEADFIELQEIPFETDAALLLCSDGLTDLVPLRSIADIITNNAGQVHGVVRALIDAANDAGGRDNVTVVYVEGERFAAGQRSKPVRPEPAAMAASDDNEVITTRLYGTGPAAESAAAERDRSAQPDAAPAAIWQPLIVGALLVAIAAGTVGERTAAPNLPATASSAAAPAQIVVKPSQSIMAALELATPGSTVTVEAGEYREQIRLKSDVRLISRIPRAATIRLPAEAAEDASAVTAIGVTGAELAGFTIVGDAATPLGTGIIVSSSSLAIVDVEITGATKVAIDFGAMASGSLIGSSVHDNPGAAVALRPGAAPRISNNTFFRNGAAERSIPAFLISKGVQPRLVDNVMIGTVADDFAALDPGTRTILVKDNYLLGRHERGRP